MIGMSRLIAERVRFDFEDLDGPISSWIETAFGSLHASPEVIAPMSVTIRFVDELRAEKGPLWPLPMVPTEGGLDFVDHLGRAARLSFPLTENEVLVDRHIDPWFFQRWVYLPILKASLWQQNVSLIHASGVAIDGHRIAISGWAGAGKSPLLLRLLEDGADFLGDDWLAISEDGMVHAISGQLNLNSWHRQHMDPARWPGSNTTFLNWLKRFAYRASAITAKSRMISLGLNRIGDAASAAGKRKVSLAEVFPEATVAAPGPLEALFFVPRAGHDAPEVARLAEAVAASSRSETLYVDDFESAIRFSHPGFLQDPLFGTITEEVRVITSGLFRSHKEILMHAESRSGVKRLAAYITQVAGDLGVRSAVA